MTELTPEGGNMLYISRGIAHGFYVTSGEAILLYRVSTMYSAEHDKGIRWDSAGISWPTKTPILSARDASLPALADFDSPFDYQGLSR
jgi:dTDP-4-dehydrorhamnose 3,5-epimerase